MQCQRSCSKGSHPVCLARKLVLFTTQDRRKILIFERQKDISPTTSAWEYYNSQCGTRVSFFLFSAMVYINVSK